MRFFVELIVRDNFDPMSAVPVQKMLSVQMDKIMNSGKVKEHGIFSDERGGFFILEVGSSEELLKMLSPILDAVKVKTHPIVSIQELPAVFKSYEEMVKKAETD